MPGRVVRGAGRNYIEIAFAIVVVVLLLTELRNGHRLGENQDQITSQQTALTAQQQKLATLTIKVCLNQRSGREQGNIRASVLTDFLATAAVARSASAANDTDPEQRQIDLKAAQHYRDLAARVELLPAIRCAP